MKTYSLESFNGDLLLSKHNTYAFSCTQFKNGTKTAPKRAEGAKIVVVFSGEMDMIVEGKPYRLKKGYWLNIPKDKEYVAHLYRSFEDCRFAILTCLKGAIDDKVLLGEISQLPLKVKENVKYAIFGQESEVMQGHLIEFTEKGAVWNDASNDEVFVFVLEGEISVKTLLSKSSIKQNMIGFIPKNKKFSLIAENKAKIIMVKSPTTIGEVKEYEDWLKKEYGYIWEDGGVTI